MRRKIRTKKELNKKFNKENQKNKKNNKNRKKMEDVEGCRRKRRRQKNNTEKTKTQMSVQFIINTVKHINRALKINEKYQKLLKTNKN